MGVYLSAKFEVSSIFLTSFRQGVILTPPTSKRSPKKPTQIRVNVKQLKMNKFVKYICQLIISTSNATLEAPSLQPRWK